MRPSVENPAARGQPQDLQYVAIGYYDVANDHFCHTGITIILSPTMLELLRMYPFKPMSPHQPLCVLTDFDVYIYLTILLPKAIDAYNDDVQQAEAGPAAAFVDEVQQDPQAVRNERASEVLRQLALLYLNDRNSQIVMIRMGPGHGDEVTVDFTLKLTNL
jgi:hypothetical protein